MNPTMQDAPDREIEGFSFPVGLAICPAKSRLTLSWRFPFVRRVTDFFLHDRVWHYMREAEACGLPFSLIAPTQNLYLAYLQRAKALPDECPTITIVLVPEADFRDWHHRWRLLPVLSYNELSGVGGLLGQYGTVPNGPT